MTHKSPKRQTVAVAKSPAVQDFPVSAVPSAAADTSARAAFEEIVSAVTNTYQLLTELEARLEPILLPAADPQVAGDKAPPVVAAPLTLDILQLHGRLQYLNTRINVITHRINL